MPFIIIQQIIETNGGCHYSEKSNTKFTNDYIIIDGMQNDDHLTVSQLLDKHYESKYKLIEFKSHLSEKVIHNIYILKK